MTPAQAVEIARQVKGVGPNVPAGVGTDGTVFVVTFDSDQEWNNLAVAVDAVTGKTEVLSADQYSRMLPKLQRLSV